MFGKLFKKRISKLPENVCFIDARNINTIRMNITPNNAFKFYRKCNLDELVGKTIISIIGMEQSCDEIYFKCSDGTEYKMAHEYDGSEYVRIVDVYGEPNNLLHTPITLAEDVSNECDLYELNEDDESYTWTWYKLATINGYVTIRWYGDSNGSYS